MLEVLRGFSWRDVSTLAHAQVSAFKTVNSNLL